MKEQNMLKILAILFLLMSFSSLGLSTENTVMSSRLEIASPATEASVSSATTPSNNNSIESIVIKSNNTISGAINATDNSNVSIGGVIIGSDKKKAHSKAKITTIDIGISRQNPTGSTGLTVKNPDNENDQTKKFREECSDFSLLKKNDKNECLENCFDILGCFEIDGCSAPLPRRNDYRIDKALFGEEESCCQQSVDKPCNNHDRCYQTCGSDQESCDHKLYNDMVKSCKKYVFLTIIQADCQNKAALYLVGVRTFGSKAFNDRQNEMCANN